jgi:hypothetical protein
MISNPDADSAAFRVEASDAANPNVIPAYNYLMHGETIFCFRDFAAP